MAVISDVPFMPFRLDLELDKEMQIFSSKLYVKTRFYAFLWDTLTIKQRFFRHGRKVEHSLLMIIIL